MAMDELILVKIPSMVFIAAKTPPGEVDTMEA